MAPSGKLRRSENLPDEGLVWAVLAGPAYAANAKTSALHVVSLGWKLTLRLKSPKRLSAPQVYLAGIKASIARIPVISRVRRAKMANS